jgi:hypothetical protein
MDAAVRHGAALSFDGAIAYALEEPSPQRETPPQRKRPAPAPATEASVSMTTSRHLPWTTSGHLD